MNVFYLSHDVDECARWHVDKHVVKMVTEYAQLLSTAHVILDNNQVAMAKVSWNHPSAVWVRQSEANYLWLYSLYEALHREYQWRYHPKSHGSWDKYHEALATPPVNITRGVPFTQPPFAMPEDYWVRGDAIASYRNYYRFGKDHLRRWSTRLRPDWMEEYDLEAGSG